MKYFEKLCMLLKFLKAASHTSRRRKGLEDYLLKEVFSELLKLNRVSFVLARKVQLVVVLLNRLQFAREVVPKSVTYHHTKMYQLSRRRQLTYRSSG